MTEESLFCNEFQFTDREIEIILLTASGLTNKLIADKLNICIGTIEYHKTRIYLKGNFKGIADMIRYGILKIVASCTIERNN